MPRLRLFQRAVPSLAPAVFFHRGNEIFPREVRPELRGDVNFGVGELPEQKVRHVHFTRCADEQIGIGIRAGVKMFAEHLDIDHGFVDVAKLDRAQQALDAIDNLEPAAIAERQDQREAVVAGRLLDRSVQLLLARPRQISEPPDRLQPHIFLDHEQWLKEMSL